MRLCGLVLCKRILLALLLDKVSRGTGRLPWVPLPASPPFCFRSTNPPKQNGGQVMTTINMKDFYYWYIVDELVEVPDEVAEVLLASRRNEAAYQRRLTRNKAFYSLDCDRIIRVSARAQPPGAPGSERNVFPSVERPQLPAGNPGPPGGRSLDPRQELPPDCPRGGRG